MSPRNEIDTAPERVYLPRPSWAPAFFALGAALAVCGVFITFMIPGWLYSAIGLVILVAALASLVRGAVREHMRLPRRQRARGAVLPIEPIRFPPRT